MTDIFGDSFGPYMMIATMVLSMVSGLTMPRLLVEKTPYDFPGYDLREVRSMGWVLYVVLLALLMLGLEYMHETFGKVILGAALAVVLAKDIMRILPFHKCPDCGGRMLGFREGRYQVFHVCHRCRTCFKFKGS